MPTQKDLLSTEKGTMHHGAEYKTHEQWSRKRYET